MKSWVGSWKDFFLGAGAASVVALVLWPRGAAAQLPPSGQTFNIQLVPGKTIILRATVGDLVNLTAPSGWGVPAASANIPGFLEVTTSNTANETTSFRVAEGGQGQVQMTVGGEVAVLSIEVA